MRDLVGPTPALRRPSMGWRGGNQPSPSSLGTAPRSSAHEAVHRVSRTVSGKRYNLDGVNGIESLRGRGSDVARTEYPKVSAMLLGCKREVFEPFKKVAQ